MTADTNYEIILYRKGTAGTITCAYDNNSIVVSGSRTYEHDEKEISSLEFELSNGSLVPSQNMLSASFVGWSNGVIGALQLGDIVRYSTYPTLTGMKIQTFYGLITELTPTADGKVKVKAEDYLKTLMKEYDRVIYSGFVDSAQLPHSVASGAILIQGDSTMGQAVYPLADVEFAMNDKTQVLVSSVSDSYPASTDLIQPFIAGGDAILGVRFDTHSYGQTMTFDVTLEADVNGAPSGVPLGATAHFVSLGGNNGNVCNFTQSSNPVKLTRGAQYWIRFHYISGGSIYYYVGPPVTGSLLTYYKSGSTYVSNSCIALTIDLLEYVQTSNYTLDAGNNRLVLNGIGSSDTINITPTQTYAGSFNRGLVSYYYGMLTNQNIADAIAKLDTPLQSVSSSNQNATSGTFMTSGKKLLDALKELANQFMPSGSWSGYQLAFAHYESAGNQCIKWGKRLTPNDPSYVTFSYADDTANDSEARIIDFSGLKQRTDLRPPKVKVIGKDANGLPLCYTITDKGLANSFSKRMEGFANVQKVSDANLNNMGDVATRGDGVIGGYLFNVWEGSIRVSGVYPELIDLDTSSASFGSGKIIALNLSPLGIVNQRFKVLGVKVTANDTTIQLSNIDLSHLNAQRYLNQKIALTEAFVSPIGLVDEAYLEIYDDYAIDLSSSWMELRDGSNVVIPGLTRVPCSKHQNVSLNANVYRAVFAPSNGHSVPPYGVAYIVLCTASSGGSYYAKALIDGGPPARDERIDKLQTMRLTVNMMTRIT